MLKRSSYKILTNSFFLWVGGKRCWLWFFFPIIFHNSCWIFLKKYECKMHAFYKISAFYLFSAILYLFSLLFFLYSHFSSFFSLFPFLVLFSIFTFFNYYVHFVLYLYLLLYFFNSISIFTYVFTNLLQLGNYSKSHNSTITFMSLQHPLIDVCLLYTHVNRPRFAGWHLLESQWDPFDRDVRGQSQRVLVSALRAHRTQFTL